MLDILSTAELTVSASIAVGFLSLAMAQIGARPDHRSGRARRLVRAGSGDRRDRRAQPRGWRRAGAWPDGRFCPVAALDWRVFRSALDTRCDGRDALAGAHRASMRSACSDSRFIILYAEGRLPAPFAPSAGWGDVFIGATALPLAWAVLRFGARVRPLVLLWNALGVADLVVALDARAAFGAGPLQVFVGPPDSSPMTTLPWLIIPGFLVPDPVFHSRRHFQSAARQDRNLASAANVWRGAGGQAKSA